ncbi:MAG TPA: TonB-dependent receptor [Bacteroidota bacterium]|nr:TonB-dependent receptor [Bacteroidota bacterium]
MNHSIYYLNRFMNKHLAAIIAVLLLCAVGLHAGQTGKISGSVKDAKTGEPIIGATVILQGTRIGAATDPMGDYYINNIAPGTYTVAVSIVGYQSTVIKNVIVKIDLTTPINIKLNSTEVVGQEVIIQAERALVQKDLTSSSVTVSSDEIKVMPVENINQIINLQAGVVGGHFRGGRSGEVAYLIDGLPINNPANGYAGFTPENSSIREMEVISGTFNAEYGQAMSGVVNIVTQDGGDQYHGSVSLYMGDYYTNHTSTFQNLDKLNVNRSKNFQASLSGPTPLSNRLTFFVTGRYQNDEGHLYGRRVFNTGDSITPLTDGGGSQIKDEFNFFSSLPGYVTDQDGYVYKIKATGDSAFVPMDPFRKYSANAKISYSLGDLKFSYGYFWEDNKGKNYNHDYQLTPDGTVTNYSTNTIHSFQIQQVMSQSTYQALKFSVNRFRSKGYLYEDPYDPRYIDPALGGAKTAYTFRSGGNEAYRYEANTQSVIGQYSISSQVSKEHKLTFGVEGRMHQLLNHGMNLINATENVTDSLGNSIFTMGYRDLGTDGNQMYDKRPIEASTYLQDKMEYENMIINAGVRVDYFDPNAKLLVDLTNPSRNPDYADAGLLRSAKRKIQVSPRLGVSFPITDQGIIHFSYGHFFQIPTFENLYNNSDFLVRSGGTLNSLMGNPDLDAQRTVSYELGLQQSLFENIGIDFTVYYRDIRNLLGTEIIKTVEGDRYGRYINRDYGSVRGLILSFDRRFANYFSLRADYTYQVAEGDASDPLSNYYNNQSDPPVETNKVLVPLGWDQRSTLNLNLTVGDMGNWTAGLIFQYGVGFPYTEDTRMSLLRFENGAVKPSTYTLDLRAEKNLSFGGVNFSISLLIYNLLDTMNEYGVNSASGRANVDLFTGQNAQKIVGLNTIEQYQNNPNSFSAPRQVRLGINLGF